MAVERDLLARYQEIELLVRIGEYKKGADPAADEALAKIDAINKLLRQGLDEKSTFEQSVKQLIDTVGAK